MRCGIQSATSDQKKFLQLIKDDLNKIGRNAIAANLSRYLDERKVSISKEDTGTFASVKAPFVYAPISMNSLTINDNTLKEWTGWEERANQLESKGGDSAKVEEYHNKAMYIIRSAAFAIIHEDVHMNQWYPRQIAEDEDPAYENQINEERRVINEDMQKIRDIQGRGSNLPGDQDKLNELINDLKISSEVYQDDINSMQSDAIAPGYVTSDKFKTSKADMMKLVKEAGDLIKTVGGAFSITSVDYPKTVQANGAKGTLTVYWTGDPVFPVKVVIRPRSCSPGLTCTTPTMTFDISQNPLVFPESIWCAGTGGWYFDYEVVIIDSRGIESAPYPAPFTCKG